MEALILAAEYVALRNRIRFFAASILVVFVPLSLILFPAIHAFVGWDFYTSVTVAIVACIVTLATWICIKPKPILGYFLASLFFGGAVCCLVGLGWFILSLPPQGFTGRELFAFGLFVGFVSALCYEGMRLFKMTKRVSKIAGDPKIMVAAEEVVGMMKNLKKSNLSSGVLIDFKSGERFTYRWQIHLMENGMAFVVRNKRYPRLLKKDQIAIIHQTTKIPKKGKVGVQIDIPDRTVKAKIPVEAYYQYLVWNDENLDAS